MQRGEVSGAVLSRSLERHSCLQTRMLCIILWLKTEWLLVKIGFQAERNRTRDVALRKPEVFRLNETELETLH
jgi:hypothetical protein